MALLMWCVGNSGVSLLAVLHVVLKVFLMVVTTLLIIGQGTRGRGGVELTFILFIVLCIIRFLVVWGGGWE